MTNHLSIYYHILIIHVNSFYKYYMNYISRFLSLLVLMIIGGSLLGCRPDMPKLAADRMRGTVIILAQSEQSQEDESGLGTGFFIDDNLIVTNAHVVAKKNNLKIIGYRDGKAYDAKVIAADQSADIAILKLDDWDDFKKNAKPVILRWGDSRSVLVGHKVWSIGNPYGLTWTMAEGVVSSKLRQAKQDRSFYIQSTTQIYPGNSGGPLFDLNGDVIAINSAIVGKEGYFGMSIPSDYARKVVSDLNKVGRINKARIGISLSESDDKHGIKVRSIEASSTSIAAGLLPNDIIKAIRTKSTQGKFVDIFEADELISETMLLDPGDMIDLKIERDRYLRTFSFEVKSVIDSLEPENPR